MGLLKSIRLWIQLIILVPHPRLTIYEKSYASFLTCFKYKSWIFHHKNLFVRRTI